MENKSIKRKKKIAKYFLIILLLEVIFALAYVFRIYKSISEVNVMDYMIVLKFYIGIFVGLVALTVVLIIAVILYVKVISTTEK